MGDKTAKEIQNQQNFAQPTSLIAAVPAMALLIKMAEESVWKNSKIMDIGVMWKMVHVLTLICGTVTTTPMKLVKKLI